MKLGPEPQIVAHTRCQIGEGPLWHPELNLLLFVDISEGEVHAYSPGSGECRLFSKGPPTAAITLQPDGSMLLFQDGRIARLATDGSQKELARGLCPGNERFNDVLADPEGRVFAGSMGGDGKLFRFDRDGRQTTVLEGLGVPNGMDFTPDLKQMYFTDSVPRRIYRFDYDRATGRLSNRKVFAEIPQSEGCPDGMTIDAEGFVWSAIWFGARLKRFAPDGRLDREVHFPVRQPSAVIFGGPDLADMYVTSAATAAADSMQPGGHDRSLSRGGELFGLRLPGIKGRAQFRSRLFGG